MSQQNRRPSLSKSVARGLEHWIPVMDILVQAPGDSELQERTAEELRDMEAALAYISAMVEWREMERVARES